MLTGLKKKIFIFFVVIIGLYSVLEANEDLAIPFKGTAMTMGYKVLIRPPLTQDQNKEVTEIIRRTFDEVHMHYNNWNPQSEISKMNELKANQTFTLSEGMQGLLSICNELYILTEGRFDPTVSPLYTLWKKSISKNKRKPTEEEIQETKKVVGWNKVQINQQVFKKLIDGVQIDLGGVAKGFAVDLIYAALLDKGYENFFIEWGGEIKAHGTPSSQRSWHVLVRNPIQKDPYKEPVTMLKLKNQALATSGNYFQYWKIKIQGKEQIFTHIVNPKTGSLLEVLAKKGIISSVTVMADNCAKSDGLATAGMIFSSPNLAKKWGQSVVDKDPGIGFWIVSTDSVN